MRRRKKRGQALRACILWLSLLSFCGCAADGQLQGMELSKRLLIEAIGLDTDGDAVTLTLLALNTAPSHADDGEGKDGGGSQCLQFTAATVGQAATLAEQSTGRVPFFAHARVLVLGRSAAKSGVSRLLDFFLRNRTVKNTIKVCVATGSAAEILSYTDDTAQDTAPLLEQLLTSANACGKSVNAPFFLFVNGLYAQDAEAFCPIVKKTKNEQKEEALIAGGTMIFKGEQARFSLTEEETTALLLLRGELKETLLSLDSDAFPVTCRIREKKAKLSISKTQADTVVFSLELRAALTEADDAACPAGEETEKRLMNALQARVAALTQSCFSKLYQEKAADLCRLRRKCGPDGAVDIKKLRLQPKISVTLD